MQRNVLPRCLPYNQKMTENRRLEHIQRQLSRFRYDELRSCMTSGCVDSQEFFMIVCESVEQVLQIFFDFLLSLHKAATRLLPSQPMVGTDHKPLPDIIKDLQQSKMTLCNSGPDVIPVASRKFSENCRSRRRPTNSAEVRRPTNENIEERHMCDNRHYYHHGHAHRHHHLHRSISTNSSHRHSSNDDAANRNNNINHHFNFDFVDGLGRVSGHEYDAEHNFQPEDYQNDLNGNFQHLHVHHQQNHHLNNNNCNRQNLNLPHISIDTVNDSDSLPALSPNAFSANDGNHDNNNNNSSNNNNNNGSQNLDVQGGNPNRALMVPIPVPRAIFHHPTPPTSPGYASQRRHSAHAILERPIPHLPDDVDPEVTKDIVHALRNIGDNLDVKMRHHNQPSVKDMLNAANLTVGQAVVMAFRRHNVLGVTFGASLHLLHQFVRL